MSTDDEHLDPDGGGEPAGPTTKPADAEVPEADGLEQVHEVAPVADPDRVSRDLEVPEADAIEQAMPVTADDADAYEG